MSAPPPPLTTAARHLFTAACNFIKKNRAGILIILFLVYLFWPDRRADALRDRIDNVNVQLIELRENVGKISQGEMVERLDRLIDETSPQPEEHEDR